MKYKNIDSALHNFGHSFMSGLNYFQDDHVMYDIADMVEKAKEKEISINFSTGVISHEQLATDRVKESVEHYMGHLPNHLNSHGVDPVKLNNVILIHRATLLGPESFVLAEDDRGQNHKVKVTQK